MDTPVRLFDQPSQGELQQGLIGRSSSFTILETQDKGALLSQSASCPELHVLVLINVSCYSVLLSSTFYLSTCIIF